MKTLLSFIFTCCVLFSFAQTKKVNTTASSAPVFITKVESISEYKLGNGMQVLLIPDATQNNVLINIVYNVGSRHEGYGETGMAHLLEHMLFKGTRKIRDIKKAIADKGAEANGTTWYDRTNYYEILSATDENLKWALGMEADRMVNSRIDKEDLDKEFSVVRNEFESGENYPDNVLEERILSTMYLWHNYGKSTIGSKEDIERVPIENLKAFYKKFYQPDNATLIVAGKFDVEKTLKWISGNFNSIPRPQRVLQPAYTLEPQQDGERAVELRRNGDIQYVAMAYHTPSYADKDFAANSAFIEMLINQPSGYLYKALVESKKATKVYGYSMALHDPGFSFFNCEVPKDKSIKDAKKIFMSTMDGIDTLTLTDEDLARAKNALIKRSENLYNNTIYFGISLANIIGAGNYKLWYVNRDRVEQLTLNDVKAVAKKFYKSSNRTWGVFIPDKAPERVKVNETPDIAALTANYKGKEIKEQKESFEASIPNIKSKIVYGSLSNGMKYALLPKPVKGDKIFATIMFKMGDEQSLSGKNTIAYLTARMLKYGTTTKSRKDISDQLDKIKTNINFYGNTNTLFASINTDKEHFKDAMAMLEDMLLHPSFDKNEYDKLILDAKADIESNMSEPMNIASEKLGKKMNAYPKGHPLYAESSAEQLEAIKTVQPEDIKAFYNNFYGANNTYASFVGGIDINDTKAVLDKSFSSWNAKTVYKEIEEKYFDIAGETETIQVNDKTNAGMLGGININLTQKDPDYVTLLMANEMLGGGAFLSSRIPKRLREAEGMSYGAGSYYYTGYKYPSGSLNLYAIYNPTFREKLSTALHEEIKKALEAGFTEEEWKSSLQSWLQQRKIDLDNNNFLVSMFNTYMYDGKDLNFYTDMEAHAKELKLSQINTTIKKYIDMNKLILIFAGDFNKKD